MAAPTPDPGHGHGHDWGVFMTHQNRIATTSCDGRRRWRRLGPIFTVLASLIGSAEASAAGEPVFARHGMVATADALATKVGVAILKAGGNAVDSAVAVGFAMAVTLPRAGNLGGGGFMMIRRPGDPAAVAIDYRETAPAAAHPDMFLDATGAVDQKRVRFSHLAVGVPGTVAGLLLAHRRFGRLSRAAVLAPAIKLAAEGFAMPAALAASLARSRRRFAPWPASMAAMFKADGGAYQAGDRFRQPDLAATLRRIAAAGAAGFYGGQTAALIAADMRRHGGLITARDLADYRARVRAPITGSYRGYQVEAMPPPSSGGVHLVQMLNMLEIFPIARWGHNRADTLHVMAEAMRRAYADRSRHLGDPDFWPVPVAGLTDKKYAGALAAAIDPARATPSTAVAPTRREAFESRETTHFSIMDRDGMAVSNTYTLNFSYGTGIIAAGTGVFLNNEMDDFSAKPGAPNAYGLLGGAANAVAPAKRPLSSMTPALISRDGQVMMATGSPGGSRIITTVLQVIMNVIDHGMDIGAAVRAPRVHHQWWPDRLSLEAKVPAAAAAELRARGHALKTVRPMGSAQTVMRAPDGFWGVADPRRDGALAAGF